MKKISNRLTIIIFILYANSTFSFDTLCVKEVGPGYTYIHLVDTTKPLSINVLKMDLTNPFARLRTAISNDVFNRGGERTSSMAARKMKEGQYIIGAVNCDFFGWEPVQSQNSTVVDGEYIKGVKLKRGMFAITADNTPYIDEFQFEGYFVSGNDTIMIDGLNAQDTALSVRLFNHYWSTPIVVNHSHAAFLLTSCSKLLPNTKIQFNYVREVSVPDSVRLKQGEYLLLMKKEKSETLLSTIDKSKSLEIFSGTKTQIDNIFTLFGGLPVLVKEGKHPNTYIGREGLSSEKFVDVNPRTAIGFNENKTELFLATVDGRQSNHSIGIPLIDLADFMIELGCYEVLNLDGGGSTNMTIRDSIVNKTSDFTGERPVYNYVIATSEIPKQEVSVSFEIVEDSLSVLKGEGIDLTLIAKDKWSYDLYLSNDEVKWYSYDVNFRINDGKLYGNGPSAGYLYAELGNFRDKVWIVITKD